MPEQTCTSDTAAKADQTVSASCEEAHSHTDTNQIKDTQNTYSISAFLIDVIEKAVKKFWTFPLKIKDLNTDQKMNLHSSFHIYPELGDETFCSILCVTFLNTCKEGFVLSDRYLYINNSSNKNLRINLLTIQSIQPTNTSDTYRIYHNNGTTQKLIVSSVYRAEIVSMLNYLINQRYYLVTSAEKQPIQDIPMSIIKYAAEEYFPNYAKKINDLTKKQTDELTRSFNIDLNSEEAFHKIVCTTLLNTCKEGFLLSNRYLYINYESYKQIAVDLRLVRRIETGKDSYTYLIHSDDGTVIHLWLVSTYRPYVINLLNCIIEKRDALLNT